MPRQLLENQTRQYSDLAEGISQLAMRWFPDKEWRRHPLFVFWPELAVKNQLSVAEYNRFSPGLGFVERGNHCLREHCGEKKSVRMHLPDEISHLFQIAMQSKATKPLAIDNISTFGHDS